MTITASAVKELRQRTGAGMMDCKKALTEAGGDMEEAVKILRTKGLAAAAKKAHRAASDGMVAVAGDARKAAMIELNCETDFVARNEKFQEFARALVEQAAAEGIGDLKAFKARPFAGDPEHTVEQAISQAIATIGENIVLSRMVFWEAGEGNAIASYVHMGGKIGVLVEGTASIGEQVLRDVAMHIAATDPRFLSRDQVTEEVLANEREIALKQAMDQGKPEHIAQRIVDGKMRKFYEEVVLLEQAFAKDPSKKVGEYVAEHGGEGATIVRYERFKLGEAG
jgi:elongation factor Ts